MSIKIDTADFVINIFVTSLKLRVWQTKMCLTFI